MQHIAERTLDLKRPDGSVDHIVVRLWAPELTGDDFWKARLDVTGPGEDRHSTTGSGSDAFHALFAALYQIPILLANRAVGGEVSLQGDPWHNFPNMHVLEEEMQVVADRRLVFRPLGGVRRKVRIYLGHPYHRGRCEVSFVRANITDEERSWDAITGTGTDEIAALIDAIRKLSSRLDWYRERGELTGADDLLQIGAALADEAEPARMPKPDERKVAITEVAEASRRFARAVARAARVLASRDRTR
jgi:hypothetical protein